jgi:hypothetical protein
MFHCTQFYSIHTTNFGTQVLRNDPSSRTDYRHVVSYVNAANR